MPKIIIDCSTFLSGIFYLGKPHQVLLTWGRSDTDLFITDEIYREYQEKVISVAERMKKNPSEAIWWFKLIDKTAIFIKSAKLPPAVCRDQNDVKYLEAAVAAEADYLIASDKDLLVLKRFGKTKIVSPARFLTLVFGSEAVR